MGKRGPGGAGEMEIIVKLLKYNDLWMDLQCNEAGAKVLACYTKILC